jgi:hypothetical protein
MTALADARRDTMEARDAMRASILELRRRTAPHELAEDALHLVDPELTFLARLKTRVMENRLVTLALIAGVAWLASPKPAHGTAEQNTTKKEKTDDSGQRQYHRHRRTGQRAEVAQARNGEALDGGEEGLAAQERRPHGLGQAQPQRSGAGPTSGRSKRSEARSRRKP